MVVSMRTVAKVFSRAGLFAVPAVRTGVVLLCALLAGCFEYNEEIWLNDDLSGRCDIELKLSEAFIKTAKDRSREEPFSQAAYRKRIGATPGLKLTALKAHSRKGAKYVSASVTFDSLCKLRALGSAAQSVDLFGAMKFGPDDKGQLVFSRAVAPRTDAAEGGSETDSSLASYRWRSTVHFPRKVKQSNAMHGLAPDTSSVTWSFTLAKLLEEPQTMNAVLAPAPTLLSLQLVLACAGALVLLVVLIVVLVMRKMKMKRLMDEIDRGVSAVPPVEDVERPTEAATTEAALRLAVAFLQSKGFATTAQNTPGVPPLIAAVKGNLRMLVQVRAAMAPSAPADLTAEEIGRLKATATPMGQVPWQAKVTVDSYGQQVGGIDWRRLDA
jgi:hypothetical protein